MRNLIIAFILFFLTTITGYGQETGLLTGTLNDKLTGCPLFGVKVTAGDGHITRTNESGVFNLTLPPGSFDVQYNRYGLQTLNLQGVNMTAGDTVTVDTTMMPVAVPVDGVVAEASYYDVDISWGSSGPNVIEKSNDEGELSDLFLEQEAGSQVAVKYNNEYDHIIGGRIFVGDGTFPGPFRETDFLVRVYDDEGMAGLPGNTLDEDTVIVDQYGWVGFDSLDVMAITDNYYLAMYQLNDAPDCAPVGCTQYPANSNSLIKYGEYNWYPFPLGNAMIRPWVSAPHDSLRIVSYRVAIYSGFDPNGDPAGGTLTEIANTNNCYYNYFAWGGLAGGCYAFGVKALYNNGLYSDYKISNIVYGAGQIDVNIKINLSDSESVGLTRIKLTGQTMPYNKYSMIIQNSDSGGFNNVNYGKYQLEIYKPGYEKFIQDSLEILSDTLFEITLQKNCSPVENLHVNPFTGLLYWEENYITQFTWQCDTPSTCHLVTTPELDLTCAEHWTLTISFNYNLSDEPASVDYSTDHGRTWALFYQFIPQPSWDTVDIDLSAFSGIYGESEIMFQVHDSFGEPYYLNLEKVRIWTPDLKTHPDQYIITLNGEPAGSSDTICYQLATLENGKLYHTGVFAVCSTELTDTVFMEFTYHQLFPPENFIGFEENDTLYFSWSPPAGSWGAKAPNHRYPDALTGYMLRYESGDIMFQHEINDPLDTTFRMYRLTCDTAYISLTAIYDLSDYGYPGESFQSLPSDPTALYSPGAFTGEFTEDWSGMSFNHNCWQVEGYGFIIVANQGNPGPSFIFQNAGVPYQAFLTSYPMIIQQSSDGNLVLGFDLKLLSNGASGNETLEFQVLSEGTSDWIMVKSFTNLLGNFDWMHFSVDLTGFVETPLFRIRLKFAGTGGETGHWTIDNIHVYNLCPGPESINAEKISESNIIVSWDSTGQKNNEREFTQYRIFRDQNESGYQFLSETVQRTYIDTVVNGGKYCYRITAVYDAQGIVCESPFSDTACVISHLAIQDNSSKSQVVCYPNPAKEYIVIRSEEDIQMITLYNSFGTKVKAIEYPGSIYRLNLSDMPSGIYLIRVALSEEVFLKKIIH